MSNGPLTVAITGSSGFLGQYFCRALRRRGYRVLALTAQAGLDVDADLVRRVPSYTDYAAINNAIGVADVRAIIHLAGRAHVRNDTEADSEAAFRTANVGSVDVVCRIAAERNLSHVVLMSSAAVAGDAPTGVVGAETPAHPSTPYARTKLEGEECARQLLADTGVRLRVFRPPLIYGPGMRGNPWRLFSLVDSGVPLPFGGIRNRRSVVSAMNLVDAVDRSLQSLAPSPSPLYVSDGAPVSTPDFVRAIGRTLNRSVRLIPVGGSILRAATHFLSALERVMSPPIRADDIRRLTGDFVVDHHELQAVFGWSPRWSLEDGLLETAEWWRTIRPLPL